MMERDELAGWLRLTGTPGVGRRTARRLLHAFGAPQAVLAASLAALRDVAGEAAALALSRADPALDTRMSGTLHWLADERAAPRHLVALGDPRYPLALLEAADPPLLLHAEGRVELLGAASVAIVGSRNPTAQGVDNARALAAALAEAGWTVVSGLALGIDAAAHEGALRAPASTIAVVGNGLDRVYPRRHAALAARIAREGLLVSEYPLGTPALAPHFPQRNRVIAGLSRGTLVVEAAMQSGSLITARMAVENGRDVFAVPGSIHSPLSRGCHALIKQGAKLVDRASDVLEELGAGATAPVTARCAVAPRPDAPGTTGAAAAAPPGGSPAAAPGGSPAAAAAPRSPATPADPLLHALGFDPVPLDALLARTGASAAELAARLLALEMEGQVARLPGQRFQRLPPGPDTAPRTPQAALESVVFSARPPRSSAV